MEIFYMREFNKLFNEVFDGIIPQHIDFHKSFHEKFNSAINIPISIYQEDDKYVVEFELAGYEAKDLKATIDDNILTVIANKQIEDKKYSINERTKGNFKRSIKFQNIDGTYNASYKNGILKIELKKVESSKSKEIKITF